MRRDEIAAEFVGEFCKTTKLRRASANDFTEAEREIGAVFPPAYVRFLTHYGSGALPDVAMMARKDGGWPMPHLLSPLEAVAASRAAWKDGMPRHLVAIARSEGKDLLCFQRAPQGERRVEETLTTFHWDLGEAVRAFESFDECLQEYCDVRFDREE